MNELGEYHSSAEKIGEVEEMLHLVIPNNRGKTTNKQREKREKE